jgi:hypothetical protein
MLCISIFIIQGFQAVTRNSFREDSSFGSMLYSIIFRIRPLSSEFFSTGVGKGFCEDLLMKRFYSHGEFGLLKGTYVSQYFYQHPSHSVFVKQSGEIITHEIHFI